VTVSRSFDGGTVRELEMNSVLFEQSDMLVDGNLFILIQPIPPRAELVGVLDLATHPIHLPNPNPDYNPGVIFRARHTRRPATFALAA
jgi:hypothetical protein